MTTRRRLSLNLTLDPATVEGARAALAGRQTLSRLVDELLDRWLDVTAEREHGAGAAALTAARLARAAESAASPDQSAAGPGSPPRRATVPRGTCGVCGRVDVPATGERLLPHRAQASGPGGRPGAARLHCPGRVNGAT